jgi:Tol biopolymer transport system component
VKSEYLIDRHAYRITSGIQDVQWSPSGRHIIFSVRESLFLIDLSTDEIKRLHNIRDWDDPCVRWSKDGEHYAFFNQSGLNVASIAEQPTKFIGIGKRYSWISPTMLAFWNDQGSFVFDIQLNRVAPAKYADGILSPDGSMVILNPEKTDRIELANFDGSKRFFLDTLFSKDGVPSANWSWGYLWAVGGFEWSTKGRQFIYWNRIDKNRIYHVDLANIDLPRFKVAAEGIKGKLSPSGSKVAYPSDFDHAKYFVADLNSQNVDELEYPFGGWAPDGHKAALIDNGKDVFRLLLRNIS